MDCLRWWDLGFQGWLGTARLGYQSGGPWPERTDSRLVVLGFDSVSPLSCCVILGIPHTLSEPPFPHLQSNVKNTCL